MSISQVLILAFLTVTAVQGALVIPHSCDGLDHLPSTGPGCGIPDYVDVEEFGDNNDATGTLRVTKRRRGVQLLFRLQDLPRPDLVMTAWIEWVDPTDPNRPEVYKTAAAHFSPAAPISAGWSSGLGREPNAFRYTSGTTAELRLNLDFNPFFDGEGALIRHVPCLQKDVPGIQETPFRQYPFPGTDEYSPAFTGYLRQYDPDTGFEMLGSDGRPMVVRSPAKARNLIIAVHTDKTTHGISPGVFIQDHYDLLLFPVQRFTFGRRTV